MSRILHAGLILFCFMLLAVSSHAHARQHEKKPYEDDIVHHICPCPEVPLGIRSPEGYRQIPGFCREIGYSPGDPGVPEFDTNSGHQKSELNLTQAEREFIKQHKTVKAAVLDNFPPFSYSGDGGDGECRGFTIDYLEIIEEKSGLDIEPRFGSWSRNYNDFKAGKVDLITAISYTEERAEFTLYTDPYYIIPTVVYTREGFGKYSGIKSLFGRKVGVEEDIYYKDILEKYGKIELVEIEDTRSMMKALSFRKVDAVITNMNIGNFLIKSLMLDNVVLAGEISLKGMESEDLRIGVNKQLPLLHSIISKAQERISGDTILALQEKWVGTDPAQKKKAVLLDPGERKYLSDLKYDFEKIKVAVRSEWHPMELFNSEGAAEGIVVEILDEAAGNLDIPLIYTSSDSLGRSIADVRNGRADAVSAVPRKAGLKESLALTDPFLSLPLVIATKSDQLFIRNLAGLERKKIGVMKGMALKERIEDRSPSLRVRRYDTVSEGLKAVSSGEIFGFVDTLASIGSSMQKRNFFDLKIAGKTDLKLNLCMAVPETEPVLLSLLNKALSTVSMAEKKEALKRWKVIKLEKGFNYMLLWKVLAAVAVVVLAVLYWNRRLNLLNTKLSREIKARSAAEQRLQESLGQARRAWDQVALLLNNSGQAFMLIDERLAVDSNYSRECINIFQKDVAGEKIHDLLFREEGYQKEHFSKTLVNLLNEEDDFKQEIVISLLPDRFYINGRYLQAEYKLLEGRQMMLIITDITEKIRLEQEVAKEHKRLSFIVTAVENKNELLSAIHEYEDFFMREAGEILSGPGREEEKTKEAFRKIHTFKSILNQYELPHSPELLHEIEEDLSGIINSDEKTGPDKLSSLLSTERMRETLEMDKEILRGSLGAGFLAKAREISVPVGSLLQIQKRLEKMLNTAPSGSEIRTGLEELAGRVAGLKYVDFKSMLERYSKYVQQLSSRLEKSVYRMHVLGPEIYVDPERFEPFVKSLVHVLRNSLIHGIEDPDSRVESGKEEHGLVYCRVEEWERGFKLVVGDDGMGIDTCSVRYKAVESGNFTWEQAEALTEAEVLELVFSASLSTRTEADKYTGRGMGLNAVKEEAEKLGGTIDVNSEPGLGTEFIFYFPEYVNKSAGFHD